jgi:hypothetical protein
MAKKKPDAEQQEQSAPVEKLMFTDVLNASRKLVNAYDEWHQSDSSSLNVGWRGQTVKAISKSLHDTIAHVVDLTADEGKEIDPKSRKLLLIIDDLAKSFRQWLMDASLELDTAPPRGNAEMHNALLRLRDALTSQKWKQPPPIKQLYELERVSPNQIAKIYGWGEDVEKVFQELEKPGTHYNPETWVPPHVALEQREIDEAWENREPRGRQYDTEQTQEAPAIPDDKKLETALANGVFLEYLRSAATIQQMSIYFKADRDTIEEFAKAEGFVLVNDCFVHQSVIDADAKTKQFQEAI